MRFGVIRVQFSRTSNAIRRNVVPAILLRDESQQVPRLRVVWLYRQNLPTNLLRFAHAS
jgi:hypothetical protein